MIRTRTKVLSTMALGLIPHWYGAQRMRARSLKVLLRIETSSVKTLQTELAL